MMHSSLTFRQKQARIPKLPGTTDRGAPLPEVDWSNRYTMIRTGTNPDGTPIIEAQPKPRPA
jgi:hypothetical protein